MKEKDLSEAGDALANWFQSQGISVEDAILLMAQTIARCVYGISRDDADVQEGLDAAADAVRKMRVVPRKP